jgi:hypothetical protein
MVTIQKLIRKSISMEMFAYLIQNNILSKRVNYSGGGEIDSYQPNEMARYCKNVYQAYLAHGLAHGLELKGKTVLEVGPGRSLGVSLLFVLGGAKQVYAVDRFNCLSSSDESVLRLLEPEYERYLKQVEHIILPIEHLAKREIGEVDLIVSNAVLEHVSDLEQTIKTFHSILSPIGMMIHKIDFRAHNRFLKRGPLYFLKYPDTLWKMMGNNVGAPNRMRPSDYKNILQRSGFEFELQPDEHFDLDEVRSAKEGYLWGTRFANMSLYDLSVATCWLVGKPRL